MQDILVTIDNYVSTDKYRINIYKGAVSMIPVASQNADVGTGPTYTFLGLPSGTDYDAEVIHFCAGNTQKPLRKTIYTSAVNVCGCPATYTANPDNTRCVRTSTMAPVVNSAILNVARGPQNVNYCITGLKVYAPGFGSDGHGAVQYLSGNTNPYWASLGVLTGGRLNIAGVWNAADPSLPLLTWIGFSKKIVIAASGLYWIAMAGDNYIRFKVNGIVLVDQTLYTGTDIVNFNFNYWHCYPVYLNAGENIIQMEGYNNESIGCFAAEIYSCDLVTLQNVTIATESTLNRVFSTLDPTIFTTNYQCLAGYALDSTGSPICKKIEYVSCQ